MSLKKWLCVPALALYTFGSLSAQNLFLTAADNTSTTIAAYTSEPFVFANTIGNAPAGTFQVIPSPIANKFYAVGRAPGDTIAVLSGTFPNLVSTSRIALNQSPVAAVLTADGQRLAILAGGVHLLNTATDQLLVTGGPLPVGANPVGLIATFDPSRIIALSSQQITSIDATQGFVTTSLTIPTPASGITMGPNGLIYVSAQNAIHEIDPNTLVIRNTIPVQGTPGKLSFTPDGTAAFAVNTVGTSGTAAFSIDIATRTASALASSGVTFDKVIAVNNNTAYGLSLAQSAVYVLTLSGASSGNTIASVTPFTPGGSALGGVRDIVGSNEGDRTRFLFVSTSSATYRYDVSGGVLSSPISAPFAGVLSYTPPPSTASLSQVVLYNQAQTLAPGQSSLPLVVRALDGLGNPVSGLPVTFAISTPGLTVFGSPAVTGRQGFAQAYTQIPAGFAATSVLITPTVGTFTTTPFTLTINTTGTGGGTGGGGSGISGRLSIVQGQGQVLSTNTNTSLPGQESLKVLVKDAAGAPAVGIPITWSIGQGSGNVFPSTSTTDANGIATADYTSPNVFPGVAFVQTTVQATTGTETVTFFVTTVPGASSGAFGTVNAFLNKPTSRVINATAGQVMTNAVEIIAVTPLGNPIPNVGLRVTNINDPNAPANGSCQGGYVLTDDKGIASCDFIATGTGSGVVSAVIGAQIRYDLTLNITGVAATNIAVSSGNSQAGTVGTQLPTPLTAVVTDANNQPVSGVSVVWEVVTTGGATLTNQVTQSDAQGRVSTSVTLGSTPGPVQIRVRLVSGTASATFTVTANSPATQITPQSGGAQSAVVSQAFAQPLQVQLLNGTTPVAGAQVTFTVVSGGATPASQIVATNAQGIAAATVTAGPTAGPIVVQASSGSLSTSFNLTARVPGPGLTAAGIVNGATFRPGISPGGIATIFAPGIAPNLKGSVTPNGIAAPLPTKLSDVEVLFNGIPAPIYAVSNNNGEESVTVQVPFELAAGTASVTVRTTSGGTTTLDGVPILAFSPGVFETTDSLNGNRYAVAYRPDGSLVTSTNPSRRGDLIRIFVTGLGQVTPATATNRIGGLGQAVNVPVIAGLNNQGIRTVSAEYLPGGIGLYLITFEVPLDAPSAVAAPLGLVLMGAGGTPIYANGTSLPVQ